MMSVIVILVKIHLMSFSDSDPFLMSEFLADVFIYFRIFYGPWFFCREILMSIMETEYTSFGLSIPY